MIYLLLFQLPTHGLILFYTGNSHAFGFLTFKLQLSLNKTLLPLPLSSLFPANTFSVLTVIYLFRFHSLYFRQRPHLFLFLH